MIRGYVHVHRYIWDVASSALRLFFNAVYLLKGTSISQSRKNSDRVLATLKNVFVSLFSKCMLQCNHAGPFSQEPVAEKTRWEFIVLSKHLSYKTKSLENLIWICVLRQLHIWQTGIHGDPSIRNKVQRTHWNHTKSWTRVTHLTEMMIFSKRHLCLSIYSTVEIKD